jgi:hypothetical protein
MTSDADGTAHDQPPDPILTTLFRWAGSAERPAALLRLLSEQSPHNAPRFWRLVVAAWPCFDAIPHRTYARAFKEHRHAWSPDVMPPEGRALYDALHTRVTLYRGQDTRARPGLSWTLSVDVARSFARGHRGISCPFPGVLTATISKRAIAFVCTDRDEDEVVLFRPPPPGGRWLERDTDGADRQMPPCQ